MKCPRCESPTLDERYRDGMTIDVCHECRGVWLDRGELEKLVSRAAPDMRERDRGRRDEDADDDEDTPPGGWRGAEGRPHPERKPRWFDTLGGFLD